MKNTVALTAFFVIAFVVLPFGLVALKGGGNLKNRVQRWENLRSSIQSRDLGREAIDDREADAAIIEAYLLPGDEAKVQARALYDKWRERKHWAIISSRLHGIEYAQSGDEAEVYYTLEMVSGLTIEEHSQTTAWVLRDGIWYISAIHEDLTKTQIGVYN